MKDFFEKAVADLSEMSDEDFYALAERMGFDPENKEDLMRVLNEQVDKALQMTKDLTERLEAKQRMDEDENE